MKTFREYLTEATIKPGDGVLTSDSSDGVVHSVLPGGDLAVVITGWDRFRGDSQSKRPNTSIEDVSDLSKKKVSSDYLEYFKQARNMKL